MKFSSFTYPGPHNRVAAFLALTSPQWLGHKYPVWLGRLVLPVLQILRLWWNFDWEEHRAFRAAPSWKRAYRNTSTLDLKASKTQSFGQFQPPPKCHSWRPFQQNIQRPLKLFFGIWQKFQRNLPIPENPVNSRKSQPKLPTVTIKLLESIESGVSHFSPGI